MDDKSKRGKDRYAVIGWPLGHSMSPLIHNASFDALEINDRFIALPLSPSEFEPFMESLPSSNLRGLAITIPYKTEVLNYCSERASEVKAIGAANTISVGEDGGLVAYNTDAGAAGRALKEAGVELRDEKVVVLGAGGAARAICFQLLWQKAGAVTIANRTLSRAESLSEGLQQAFSDADVTAIPLNNDALAEALETARIIVNTTSLGMYPYVDECPVDTGLLKSGMVVFDIIYNPVETKLLRAAREKGSKALPGTDMLVYQAAEQERIWLGVDAPINMMRKALLKELSKAS